MKRPDSYPTDLRSTRSVPNQNGPPDSDPPGIKLPSFDDLRSPLGEGLEYSRGRLPLVRPSGIGNPEASVTPDVSTVPAFPATESRVRLEVVVPRIPIDGEAERVDAEFCPMGTNGPHSRSTANVIPVWLSSLLIHLVMLLVLGLLTIAASRPMNVITVTLDDRAGLVDQPFVDISSIVSSEPLPSQIDSLRDDGVSTEALELPSLWQPDSDFVDASLLQNLQDETPLGTPIVASKPKKSGTSFFGVESSGASFVFVIDCSQSMQQNYRWARARDELKYAIDRLQPDQQFLVLLYNSRTYIMMDVSAAEMSLLPATDENKIAVTEWLWNQFPNGGTYPKQAMGMSLGFQPDAIFLLSDGEIRDGTPKMLKEQNASRNRLGELKRQVPVHTVALGSRVGLTPMQVMARQSGGQFRWVR